LGKVSSSLRLGSTGLGSAPFLTFPVSPGRAEGMTRVLFGLDMGVSIANTGGRRHSVYVHLGWKGVRELGACPQFEREGESHVGGAGIGDPAVIAYESQGSSCPGLGS